MTVKETIRRADALRPNTVSEEQKAEPSSEKRVDDAVEEQVMASLPEEETTV